MMNLYEITNGYLGESYVRVYVWAKDDKRAKELALAAFAKEGKESAYARIVEIRILVSEGDAEFCTVPSDCGWTREGDE